MATRAEERSADAVKWDLEARSIARQLPLKVSYAWQLASAWLAPHSQDAKSAGSYAHRFNLYSRAFPRLDDETGAPAQASLMAEVSRHEKPARLWTTHCRASRQRFLLRAAILKMARSCFQVAAPVACRVVKTSLPALLPVGSALSLSRCFGFKCGLDAGNDVSKVRTASCGHTQTMRLEISALLPREAGVLYIAFWLLFRSENLSSMVAKISWSLRRPGHLNVTLGTSSLASY